MKINNLSSQDAIALLEIIHDSLLCSTEKEIRQLMKRLSHLLPYQAALSCIGKMREGILFEGLRVVNIDYPESYLGELAQRELVNKDPVVQENFRDFRLQYWEDTFKKSEWTEETYEIVSLAEDYGFSRVSEGCGYAYGVRNYQHTEGSFFCYHGLERCSRTEEILTLVVPHLHTALVRLAELPGSTSPLTTKETEILNWVKEGKGTWEISRILTISERTVKFHIANIMRKLDATTRTHALAIALEKGYVALA